MRVVKAGILDDVSILNDTKPGAELYAPDRINWVQKLDGTQDMKGMPEH